LKRDLDGLKDSLLYSKEEEKEDPVTPAAPTPPGHDTPKTDEPKPPDNDTPKTDEPKPQT
jgi:hypothetical protein